MYRAMLLSFVSLLAVASAARAQQLRVQIDSPRHRATVEQTDMVQGVVSGANAEVWVVVHPTATGDYWVQPEAFYEEDGKWSVMAYFGRPGRDYGARFHVAAIVNPTRQLREGMVFNGWPRAAAMSSIITVTRR